MVLNEYMKKNFTNFPLEKPLFYCGQQPKYSYGSIRFEIGSPEIESDLKYCSYATIRATILFKKIFDDLDDMYVVINSFKKKNEEIDIDKCQKHINQYTNNKIENFELLQSVYGYDLDDEDNDISGFRYYLNCKVKDFDCDKLLKNICFGNEHEEIFFINANKNVIYHLYDDRGADIVSNKISTLLPIYNEYNDWILEYDRQLIDNIFKNN